MPTKLSKLLILNKYCCLYSMYLKVWIVSECNTCMYWRLENVSKRSIRGIQFFINVNIKALATVIKTSHDLDLHLSKLYVCDDYAWIIAQILSQTLWPLFSYKSSQQWSTPISVAFWEGLFFLCWILCVKPPLRYDYADEIQL